MIDVASTSSEPSHEALRGGSGCRQHRPADLERPLRSLSAGPLVSAVMGGSDRDATPDGEHRVSVDVHTEASGADGVALRGSAVRHHVSDPSDGDMDQAEQPRHYSSTNDDDESEYDVGYAAASTVPLGSARGLDLHYGAAVTALATNSLQNYLLALHPHAQRPHWKVSALSGRHCAVYLPKSDADALRPARAL